MRPEKINILNGINLYCINDTKYKTVSMSLFLRRPLKRSEVTKNALITNVLKRGTNKNGDLKSINRTLDMLYGADSDVSTFKRGNVQVIMANMNFLSEKYAESGMEEKCTEFLCNLLFDAKEENNAFVKSYVDSEKVNLKDEIESIINDKRTYADYRCTSEMFKGEDAGLNAIGYTEDLKDINEKNLYEHYRKILFESPIDIFAVGDVNTNALAEQLKRIFSKYTFNISPVYCTVVPTKAGDLKTVTESLNVNQGKLSIGFKTMTAAKDELYYPLVVANSVFGSGAHSLLFNNVREKLSLCYYAASRINKFTGSMLVSSGIEFKNYEKAKDEIFVQLDAVKNGDFKDSELTAAKEFLINMNKTAYDSPLALKIFYLENILIKNDITLEEANKKIAAVTKDDIKKAFSKVCADTIYFLKGNE